MSRACLSGVSSCWSGSFLFSSYSILFLLTLDHACVHVVHVEVRGQFPVSSSMTVHLTVLTGSLTEPAHQQLARLASGIFLSLRPQG